MSDRPILTLTTDFGLRDFYAGALKGSILTINPGIQVIDVAHTITGHDVLEAAFIIRGFYRSFPKGTAHVAVVDPGVGGARRPILVESKDYYFIGPDNGIFSYVYQMEGTFRVVHLTATQHFAAGVSDTFHGRDIFGPVAAHLLDGLDPRWLGQEITDFTRLPLPEVTAAGNRVAGQVVYVDRFGNLVTNIEGAMLAAAAGRRLRVSAGAAVIDGLSQSYDRVAPGAPVALVGSLQTLEISVNRGSASAVLGLARGAEVRVEIL
jgi:S-adenosyl-L-methionine hydrolase (adenosine-forming)